jgi:acyl-CoA synthetase (AMP-forming)/AMP-acid ligase II
MTLKVCSAVFSQADRRHVTSYRELLGEAQRYFAVYRERSVERGDVVLIMLRHGPELVPSFLGALLIGALASFLPFLTPKQLPDLYGKAHAAQFEKAWGRRDVQ